MATYAPVPAFAERKRHPHALILVVAGHAAVLAALMAAKMDMPTPFEPTRTTIDLIEVPQPPPPEPLEPQQPRQPSQSVIDRPVALVPVPADATGDRREPHAASGSRPVGRPAH